MKSFYTCVLNINVNMQFMYDFIHGIICDHYFCREFHDHVSLAIKGPSYKFTK